MDWNDLRYLLAVQQRGSLAAAAKELGVTKATMSRRLAALEAALEVRLLDRRPNGLTLTAAGREAVAAAEQMASATVALEARIASTSEVKPRGTVRLTAPPWLAARFIIPELPRLKAEYPDLDVQLLGTDQILNLAQGESDLALRNVRPTHASLTSRRLLELGGCVYASKLYLERHGVPRARDALHGHALLLYEGLGGMAGFEWMRDPLPGTTIAFRANGPEGLVSAASAGLGLAAIPCLLGDRESALERIEALGVGHTELLLVSHEQNQKTPRVRVVADFIAAVLIAHRAEIDPFRS